MDKFSDSYAADKVDELARQCTAMTRDRNRRMLKRLRSGYDFNSFLTRGKLVVRQWYIGKNQLYIVRHKMGHFCGYVRFPKRPVKETGYKGILTYVPVHGGITYAHPSPDRSMVYGFDCAHAEDRQYDGWDFAAGRARFEVTRDETDLMPPVVPRSLGWLQQQCITLMASVLICARFERAYELAGDVEARARIIDNLHKYLSDEHIGHFELGNNFGAMINILSGRL